MAPTRRDKVPFDPYFFETRVREGVAYSPAEAFRLIYQTNLWRGKESLSGAGASADETKRLRAELPALLGALRARVLLDLPCGDFGWMSAVDLPVETYVGADIVPELIARNEDLYGDSGRRFLVLDLLHDPLPPADLILCRDCLVHFSFADVERALANIRRSRIPYLLTTTFPEHDRNEDIVTGDWRLLNLERPPLAFPPPLRLVNEECGEAGGAFRDKSLGLWRVADLGA